MSHQRRRQEEQGPWSVCRLGTQHKGVGSLIEKDVNRADVGLGEENEGVSVRTVLCTQGRKRPRHQPRLEMGKGWPVEGEKGHDAKRGTDA